MRTAPTDNRNDTDDLGSSPTPLWRRFALVAVYGVIFIAAATFGLVRYLKWRAAKNERPVRAEETMSYAFKDELPFFVPRLAEIDQALGMNRYGPAREALEQLLAQVASPEMKTLVKERLRDAMALQSLVVMLGTKIAEAQDDPPSYARESGSIIQIVGMRPDCLIVVDSEKPRLKLALDWHDISPREMHDILHMYGLLEQLPLTSALFCAVNGFEAEFRAFAFEAWNLFPDDRDRIAAWFSWAARGRDFRACRVPGFKVTDLVAWEGKLITTEEEKAIAAAAKEADRQRAEKERLQREENERLRLEEERRRREVEMDVAARERERLADEAEDREFPIALSELDRLVKVFRYGSALQGLQEYRGRLRQDKYRQQVTQRINEVEKFLQLFERLKKT
ncbi:MAG: hypothetical protein RDV41_11430, partial [Planctomycetota bacterium]|nr:hypothetical protein [Planctomycetota bacterium]